MRRYGSEKFKEWAYEVLKERAAQLIEEGYSLSEIEDKLREVAEFLADDAVDPYTASLLEWYREDLCRLEYADEAIAQGADHMLDILPAGQYLYYLEICNEALEEVMEELEE